jgi:hygromycin-B 4-O-kinase
VNRYGFWNEGGHASKDSWGEFILDNRYAYMDDSIFIYTLLERELVERICSKIEQLAPFLPEDLHLVHGDVQLKNIISDGITVTGVVDWGESLYGDFLYDIAGLYLESEYATYQIDDDMIKDTYSEAGFNLRDYYKRYVCYQLKCGLRTLHSSAMSEQSDRYAQARDWMASLLDE